MKNIISIIVIVLLFFVSGNTNAQVIVTKNGMQPITVQPVNLVLKDFKGDIQWQRSTDKTSWEDITDGTNDTLEVTISETWHYRAKVTAGTCDPYFSDTTSILHDYQIEGDTSYIVINTPIVGPEDNSAAWWASFSDYFSIPTDKLLHLEFVNYSSGANNWNNWNLAIANKDRDSTDYAEYFVLRSDAYGWGNADWNINMITKDYRDMDGDADIWNDFRSTMNGAYVTMDIDHSATGNVYVTATAVGTNDSVLVETYHQPVSATDDIVAFLICDGSHFDMKKAYLIPSKVTVEEDFDPDTIVVAGAPSSVEIGDTNFWGDAIATVTFSDGSAKQIDSADLVFTVVPDIKTIGEKKVTVSYNKTKLGEVATPVETFYTLDVTNPVTAIEVTTLPKLTTYYFYGSDDIIFDTAGIEITATYSDATTAIMDKGFLVFNKISAVTGTQDVVISYEGKTSTVTTTCQVTLIDGINRIGATDFSTGWWTEFSEDSTVTSGDSVIVSMYCYSDNLNNWHSPCVILRKADLTEYAVVRMDNYGWGDSYAAATLSNDWDWSKFSSNISGSKIVIKVKNNGDGTADVRYDVTYISGETHYQEYKGITIDSSDLNCALVGEASYFVIVNND